MQFECIPCQKKMLSRMVMVPKTSPWTEKIFIGFYPSMEWDFATFGRSSGWELLEFFAKPCLSSSRWRAQQHSLWPYIPLGIRTRFEWILICNFPYVWDFFLYTTGCAIKNWTHSLNHTCSHDRNPSKIKTTFICYYTELFFRYTTLS